MKQFVNFDLGALNALTVAVDRDIVAEFKSLSEGALPDPQFTVVRPQWSSDLQWVSANEPESFAIFQSAFDRLGIAEHVAQYLDLEREPRLYAGFLLLRTNCSDTDFHVDWIETNNEAFTFITPLDDRAQGFGLLYKKVNDRVAEYDYKLGEGIIFGDRFQHSTKPGNSQDTVALLCFNFGTDKMEHWDKILKTAGYQCLFIRQPDGQFTVRKGSRWIPLPVAP